MDDAGDLSSQLSHLPLYGTLFPQLVEAAMLFGLFGSSTRSRRARRRQLFLRRRFRRLRFFSPSFQPLEPRQMLAVVNVTATDPSAAETGPDSGTFTITRDSADASPLTVNYMLSGTATYGTDYTGPSGSMGSVTIAAYATSAQVPISPVADSLVEGSEYVQLNIYMGSYSVGPNSSAQVTIADGAASLPTVTVAATDPNASETGPDAGVFTISRTGSTMQSLTVMFALGGTATQYSDYNASYNGSMNSVTIPMGSSSTTITINPQSDSQTEGSESVILSLSTSSSYDIGTPSSAQVTIADAVSSAVVSVTASDASAAESNLDTGAFTISRTGSTSMPLTVNFYVDGAATSGSDYDSLGTSVTIPMGSSSAVVYVTPRRDNNVESSESVVLHLSGGLDYTVSGSGTATVNIQDDPPVVYVSTLSQAAETGLVSGSMRLSRGGGDVNSPLTVYYSVSGTATAGSDYTSIGNSATIAAGQSSVDFSVAPLADALSEPTETVILTLSSGGMNYQLGSPTSATVQITDAVPTVTVSTIAALAFESNAQAATYRFQRSGDTSAALVVQYNLSGTATNGTDYTSLSGSITIPSGQSTADLTLTPTSDSTTEVPESAIVTIASNSAYAIGSASSATAWVQDAPAVVSISATDASASEVGPDSATLTVTLDHATPIPLVIGYTIGGTATAGSDYQTLSGSVTILEGQSSASIVVTPLTDSATEASETVILTLQANSLITLGSNSSATANIADAVSPISINPGAAATINEGGTLNTTASFSDASGAAWVVTINYGDNSPPVAGNFGAAGNIALNHVYAQDGQYQVTISITANDGRTASATKNVTVNNVAPTVNLPASATAGQGLALALSGSLVDPGADAWTAEVDYGDGSGAQPIAVNGKNFTLDHIYNSPGTHTATVTVTDNAGATGSATVEITVDAPPVVSLSGSATFVEDAGSIAVAGVDASITDSDSTQLASLSITLTDRTDVEEVLTVDTTGTSIASSYENGILLLSGAASLSDYQQVLRTLRYNNTAHGMQGATRTISVVANDGIVGSAAATATVTLQKVNDAPVAFTETLSAEQGFNTQWVLGEDGDGETEQTLTLTIVTAPAHGTISRFDAKSGTIWFTPDPGYVGTDSFSYYLTDDGTAGSPGNLSSATVTRSVVIVRANEPPLAAEQTLTTDEDTPLALTLTGDDGDDDVEQVLTFSIVDYPLHGTLTNFDAATGAVTYTPDPNYVGDDSFTFAVTDDASIGLGAATSVPATVSLTVAPVNDSPVSAGQTIGVALDTPRGIALGTDGDAETAQTLTLNIITAPTHGILSGFDPLTGQVTYTPDAGYLGEDGFTYSLTDDDTAGGPPLTSSPVTVSLIVAAAPTASDAEVQIDEDTPVSIALEGDDGNPSAVVALAYAIVNGPAHGTIEDFDEATGTFRYVPALNYNGADEIRFEVAYLTAGGVRVASAAATVSISIAAVNDEPLDEAQVIVSATGEPIVIYLGSDGDPEVVQALTLTIDTAPLHGTLTDFDPEAGTILYTPDPEFVGEDTFSYTLTDDDTADGDALTSAGGNITLRLRPRPTLNDQETTIDEDTPWSANFGGSAAAGGTLFYAIATPPTHGKLTSFDPATGAFAYQPDEDYSGDDTFVVTVTESLSGEDESSLESLPATMTITVSPRNDQPLADEQELSVAQDGSLEIALTGDDADPDFEQALTYAIVAQPAHGTIEDFDAETGTFTYIPDEGYFGDDTVTFTITDDDTAGGAELTSAATTITIHVGAKPTGAALEVETDEDTPLNITLAGTDGDDSGESLLTYLILTPPSHGRITNFDQVTGTLTYEPDGDFSGEDSFTYAVLDQWATPGQAVQGEPATVTITVHEVNDAPRAYTQDAWTSENSPVVIGLGDSGDIVAQLLTLTILSAPQHGTISGFNPETGEVTYTPDEGYVGSDGFTFTLTDNASPALTSTTGTVAIVVAKGALVPIANPANVSVDEDDSLAFDLTGSDGDPDHELPIVYRLVTLPQHGQVTLLDPTTGHVLYQPDADYNGPDSFEFVVDLASGESASSQPANIEINVGAVNDLPTAKPLSVIVNEDQSVTIRLQGSGGDSDEEVLTYLIVSAPQHGTITGFKAATGELIYTPSDNYTGSDSFTYVVSDDGSAGGPGGLTCNPQTVSITVRPDHQTAEAAPLAAETLVDQAVALQLGITNASSGKFSLTFAITAGPSHGTISNFQATTGQFTYTPSSGYTGVDELTFTVTDNASNTTSSAPVVINVTPVTTLPGAVNDQFAIQGETILDVLSNDTHAANTTLSITSYSSPNGGTLTLVAGDPNASGALARDRLKFTPNSGFTGTTSFTYTVQDTLGHTSSATVQLTVQGETSLPTDGGMSPGGGGFNGDPDSDFTPPIFGNVWISRTQTGGFTKSWTDPAGNSYNGSGTQTTTITVSATLLPNGMWTYVETATWTYDVTAGSAHLWGNYHYTLTAGLIAGTRYFTLDLRTDDNYSYSATTTQGDASNGSITTSHANGHEGTTLYKSKHVNLLGATFIARTTKTSDSNFGGTTDYWHTTQGGGVVGTANTNGSTYDYFSMNTTWTAGVLGNWTVSGSVIGNGNGDNNTGYGGGGTYAHDVVSGVVTEGGYNNSNYNYTMSGSLQANLQWDISGTGNQSASKLNFSSYIGAGVRTQGETTASGSWSLTSAVLESGTQKQEDESSLDLGLTGQGWGVTSGMATATGESRGFSFSSGTGTYTNGSSSSTGSWSITGSLKELNIDQRYNKQTVISSYDGLVWTAVGAGSASGSSLYFRSNSGSGNFTNNVLDGSGNTTGSISGRKWEDGSTLKTNNFTTASLMVNGLWIAAGTASGFSDVRAHGSFSGSGSYTFDRITRRAWQSGSEDTSNTSNSIWTLNPAGAWVLTGGSGSTDTKNGNSGSYSGSGTYTVTASSAMSGATGSGSGSSWSWSRVTRWDSGDEGSEFKSHSDMNVVAGQWKVTGGSGSGNGHSNSSSSFSATGRYGYSNGNMSVSGGTSASGANSLNTSYSLNSNWDPNAASGAGGWVSTGDSSGSSMNNSRSESSGTGTMTISSSSNRGNSSGSGTITEDNNERTSGNRNWKASLNSSGTWVLTSGSGSGSGGGGDNFTLNGSGTYRTWLPDSWGNFSFSNERHNSNGWDYKEEVTAGDWKRTSGSGSSSGSTRDFKSTSATGQVNVQKQWGAVLYRTASSSVEETRVTYNTNSTINANGDWVTTGNGTGFASGSNMKSQGTQNARYRRNFQNGVIQGTFNDFEISVGFYTFNSNFALNASGNWILTSGSGENYTGDGVGQAFSGSGNYSMAGFGLQANGEVTTWSLNGTVKEGGGWNATEGDTTQQSVASGAWVVTGTSKSGTQDEFSSFSNKVTGNYSHGTISGTFKRNEVDGFNSHYVINGALNSPASGSGSSHQSHDYDWSYSGNGPKSMNNTTGTWKESGSGGDGWSEDLKYSRSGSTGWLITSGSGHTYNKAAHGIEYSGSASYSYSGNDGYGNTWSMAGTQKLELKQSYSIDESDDDRFQNGKWKQVGGSRINASSSYGKSSYSGSGAYTTIIAGGSITGQQFASGYDEGSGNVRVTETFANGGWTKVGNGNNRAAWARDSSSSGSGTYTYGTMAGSVTESTKRHASSEGNKTYRLFGDTWKVRGDGTSDVSGEDHFSFSGSGTYSRAVNGGTMNGTVSESGRQDSGYSSHADFKLGQGEQWVLVGGTGISSGSGEYHYSSSGSGNYTKSFDGDGVLSGTMDEKQRDDWKYNYQYDSNVVDHAWVTTASGGESSSGSSSFHYSGSGARDVTTTDANGFSENHSTLSEDMGNGSTYDSSFNWQLASDGQLSYQYLRISSSSASGQYAYTASGSSQYTYNDGNYAGGNGTTWTTRSDYDRQQNERFDWKSTTTDHENLASGVTTTWSDTIGSGSGSGRAFSDMHYSGEWHSNSTSPYYTRHEDHMSSSGSSATDNYSYTGDWSHSLATDGSQTFTGHLTNQVDGSGQYTYSYSNFTSESWSSSGSGSGGGWSTSTGDAGGGTSPMPGYNETVNYPGFYTNAYNQNRFAWGIGSIPASGNYSYTMPGDPNPPMSGSGGPGGGGNPAPDPLAGGPWFPLANVGDDPGLGLYPDVWFIHSGAGGSVTFEDILGIKQDIPDPESPYGNAFYEFLGENIIRPVVGDENLIGASDFQLFLGTAIFATVLVVGIWVAPGAVAVGAISGAVIGAGYNIAGQLDQGATLGTLDWGQVGKAALAGGVTGAFMGAAFGLGAAAIPGFCTVATVLGVGASVNSLYNAYNNFNQGNYYTATLDAALGIFGLYGAAKGMFRDMSKAAGGGCFTAETEVVICVLPPVLGLAQQPSDAEEGGISTSTIALATGAVLAAAAVSLVWVHRDRRRREEEEREAFYAQLAGHDDENDSDQPVPDEDENGIVPQYGTWNADEAYEEQEDLDHLCDKLFHGVPTVPKPPGGPPLAAPVSTLPLAPTAPVLTRTATRPERSAAVAVAPVPKTTAPRCAPSKKSRRWEMAGLAALWVATMLFVASILKFGPFASSDDVPMIAAAPAAQFVTKSIAEVQTGEWLVAHNPELTDEERELAEESELDWRETDQWRKLTMQLEKTTGGTVSLELLRSVEWIEDYGVREGEYIDLEDTDLEATGRAYVESITACPEIGPPPVEGARIVTGRFVHSPGPIFDLTISDGYEEETIGVTAVHPIWSEDREAFVPAGELKPNERLITAAGNITHVTALVPRAGPEAVYNLEIDVEHVYYVSQSGILVHNTTPVSCAPHGNTKAGNRRNNHVYEIKEKATGQVRKYGISGGKVRQDGKSYRAESQVRKLNRAAGYEKYESRIIRRNLTRARALSTEQGRVNGYSKAVQRGGGGKTGPPGNALPQPTM